MADSKVTQLTALTTTAGTDLLYIVDDATGTPVSKKISINNLFGAIPSNTSISGTLTTTANNTFGGANTVVTSNVNFTGTTVGTNQLKIQNGSVTLGKAQVVSSNNATTQFSTGGLQGTFFWDEDYLYLATSNTVIKRVALGVFSS